MNFNMPADKFLAMTANILHAGFVGRNKAAAKKDFKKLVAGGKLEVGNLGPREGEEKISLMLAMDASEYRGGLTYHAFDQVLRAMLQAISKRLNAKPPKEIQTFTNERSGQTVFFVPGFIEENGIINMLVSSVVSKAGKLTIQLMFLDPDQFKREKDGDSAVASTRESLAEELSEISETLAQDSPEQQS